MSDAFVVSEMFVAIEVVGVAVSAEAFVMPVVSVVVVVFVRPVVSEVIIVFVMFVAI